MKQAELSSPASTALAPPARFGRLLGLSAVVASLAVAILLGVRLLNSPDLGYHLAYGDQFWSRGVIVDNSPLYLLPPAQPNLTDRPEPGPGCWYDGGGNYRFANANWLSQIVMSGVHNVGGPWGLCVLQAALVMCIFLTLLATMRRLGLPRLWQSAGLLLIALTSYERFNLRPEVMGYAILAAQLYLLCTWKPTWLRGGLIVLLQLLLVNLHSYFMLGLFIIGAFAAEAAIHSFINRRTVALAGTRSKRTRDMTALMATLMAAVGVSFVNPWTWRLAILPIQTLLFLRKNDIAGSAGGEHPWSHIGEFYSPFATAFAGTPAGYAYFVLLAIAAAGLLAALLQRRFSWAMIILALGVISLSMRRNIAPASMLIAPLALASLGHLAHSIARRWPDFSARLKSPCRAAARITTAIVLLAAVGLSLAVVTNRFYASSRSPLRFGMGLSRVELPIDACRWLSESGLISLPISRDAASPSGSTWRTRVWTDYNSSSSAHYFTTPHASVPVLTNTWAYPPTVMQTVLQAGIGAVPFDLIADAYDVHVALLRVDDSTSALAYQLSQSKRWALMHCDALFVVFARTDGLGQQIAAKQSITPENFDVDGHVRRLQTLGDANENIGHLSARTLWEIGFEDQAIAVARKSLGDRTQPQSLYQLGRFLAIRGTSRLAGTEKWAGRKDIEEAISILQRAEAAKPDYQLAISARKTAELTLEQFKRGIVPKIVHITSQPATR